MATVNIFNCRTSTASFGVEAIDLPNEYEDVVNETVNQQIGNKSKPRPARAAGRGQVRLGCIFARSATTATTMTTRWARCLFPFVFRMAY